MKYFGLIWRNAWRKKIRTSLTILSVFVAFLLFTLLSAVGYAFGAGANFADAERLIVINKITLINPLPIAYQNRIAAIPGVRSVTHNTWFGGYYQDERNQFAQFPVDPDEYLSVYSELVLPDEQFEAWRKNRTGAIVGQALADQYGWQVGDRIPIQATIWTKADGGRTWEFDIEGIFSSETAGAGATAFMLFQYDYFDEARAFGKGTIGWYVLRVEPEADPVQIADTIDQQFANSASETETSTEEAFAASFAKQYGDIGLIVRLILGAVFFTLLLVAGNTMSQSVRERISELAVLKTLGFTDLSVLITVLAEAMLILAIGAILGLGLGWLAVEGLNAQYGTQVPLYLTPMAFVTAFVIMVAAGILSGIMPALQAMRLTITDALARG